MLKGLKTAGSPRTIKKIWLGRVCGVLLFLSFGFISSLLAQPSTLPQKNLIFDQLSEKLGLSQSSVNCVMQDSEGFLWIGTWSGLIRYDGYSVTVFHSDNAPDKIKSNKIATIYEDRHGYIWIGTHQGGLFRYDKNTNKFLNYTHDPNNPKSLSNKSVWSIREDKAGRLWVGTEFGLNVMDQKTGTFQRFYNNYNDAESLSQNFVTDIFLSSSGDLWIATEYGLNGIAITKSADTLVCKFHKYLYTADPSDAAYHHHVCQVGETISANGPPVIWFATKKGIKRLENGKITNYMIEGKPTSFNLFRSMIVVPGAHPYIIAGSETGLSFLDPLTNKFTTSLGDFDGQGNLSHNTVTALFMDRAGVLWVGTKKGLNKYDSYSKSFEFYQTVSFDPTRSIITAICNSRDGGYWISTIGGGLFKFRNKIFTHYKIDGPKEDDYSHFIQTLYADTRGNIWVGTAGAGIFKFNEQSVEGPVIKKFDHFINSSEQLSDDYIMAITEDVSGNIWAGTWSRGLNRITPEGKITQYTDPLLIQSPIIVLNADRSGTMWIGTRGNGLYRMKVTTKGNDLKHYHNEPDNAGTLSNNFVNAIYEDHAGGLWIGTEGGLNALDRRTEKFANRVLAEGPSNEVIVSILEDDAGKLWLSHWDGLTVIDPLNSGFTKTYDYHDRIQGGFFYSNVCLKDKGGRLLFGGSDGFNIIDPAAVVPNPFSTKVAITDFQISNKPVPYGQEFDGRVILDKPLAQIDKIQLGHDENSFSFEFTSLDYASPEKIRYAYMLEGFSPEWNYTNASRRYANYTNLDQGEYVFKVKATNNDGEWNDSISSVRVVVQPPWWKTVWAILAYAVIVVLVLHFFRKLILMRANLLHDVRLERVQRENMEKLNRSKLQFFTNISHEFRTPLTLILGPVQSLMETGEGGKFFNDQVQRINTNAQRLLRLINQLLDFRKAESGNMRLQVAEGNLARFVKEVKLSFDGLADHMKVDFSLQCSSNVVMVWFDRDQFEKILFNLLSNAFKNTPAEGRISITVTETKDSVCVVIEDNGKGIRKEHFDNIFDTFFSYDEDRHQTGTGIGLALTKSLVDMHHGIIEAESVENEYTRFTIRLQKGNAHFDASEIHQEPGDPESLEHYPSLENPIITTTAEPEEILAPLSDLPKLLIVEDNAEVRTYIKSIFSGYYLVLEAKEGQEGLHLALEEIPDIIVSDVMMPLMDGIMMCKQLKENVKTSHIPVILLTARTNLIFKVEGLQSGADDYITKPFNPTLLQLKVRNLMRTRAQMRKLFVDNKFLDVDPHRITLNSSDEKFIQDALKSVEAHMDDGQYSVDELIKDVGMSRMQLYRKLKALTGQSANEFIRTLRLKRAAQLLEQHQLTIAEITYEVGFSDLQYFRECFKKYFGVTPSEYEQTKANTNKEDRDQSIGRLKT